MVLAMLAICLTVTASGCKELGREWSEDVKSITVYNQDFQSYLTARNQNSAIYQKIVEKMGFDVVGESGSATTYLQQLNLRWTEGDLPEIFAVDGLDSPEMMQKFIETGDIAPISDYVTEAEFPNLYAYLQQFEYMKRNVSYFDNKLYFIPRYWENEKSMYVRQDWIDNLNAKLDGILVAEGHASSAAQITDELRQRWRFGVPKDLIEFYRLARAFTLYDPDNNGQDDTIGYMSEENKDFDGWVFTAFGTLWHQYVPDGGGKYKSSHIADESKLAINFLNRMINEGYMSRDSAGASMEDKQKRLTGGKIGMVYAHNWYNNFLSDLISVDKITLAEARERITMFDPPAGPDGRFGGVGRNNYYRGFAVNGSMGPNRTKACLKLFDYLYGDEGRTLVNYGVEGLHYEVEDGEKKALTNVSPNGIRSSEIKYVDGAGYLSFLVSGVDHFSQTTQTNADIIVPRQKRSAENIGKEDYPDIQTASMISHRTPAREYFLEKMALWTQDISGTYFLGAPEWDVKTLGWDDFKRVPVNLNNSWNSYVREYLDSYKGQTMMDEYNRYIASGKAQKAQA
jgi:ABC-type glycerol-3-phosphate transport system substrate-binding protein